ncbi:hypothetical protein PLUTE_a2428 [Pseudoalteromonas luteoviolacea DSM 6061]|nr:hypothetical protein [Pseudoalteromonas luteoviolacea DSM 6061]
MLQSNIEFGLVEKSKFLLPPLCLFYNFLLSSTLHCFSDGLH